MTPRRDAIDQVEAYIVEIQDILSAIQETLRKMEATGDHPPARPDGPE